MQETEPQVKQQETQQTVDIPEGYTVIKWGDQLCIVPEYLVPATHQAFDRFRKRQELNVSNEEGGVSQSLI